MTIKDLYKTPQDEYKILLTLAKCVQKDLPRYHNNYVIYHLKSSSSGIATIYKEESFPKNSSHVTKYFFSGGNSLNATISLRPNKNNSISLMICGECYSDIIHVFKDHIKRDDDKYPPNESGLEIIRALVKDVFGTEENYSKGMSDFFNGFSTDLSKVS